jgi:hypothetical protein
VSIGGGGGPAGGSTFVGALSALGPDAVFGPPFAATSVALGTDAFGLQGPVAGLPGDGATIEAYTLDQTNDAGSDSVSVSAGQVITTLRPAGADAFEAPVQLSAGPGIPSGPAIAAAGVSTVVLWSQLAGCRDRIYSSVRPADTGFSPATVLSPDFTLQGLLCGHGGAAPPVIAAAGRYLVAGWLQGDVMRTASLSSRY